MTTDVDTNACELAHALNRLLAMRRCAARLFAHDRLGRDSFACGQPFPFGGRRIVRDGNSLTDLLRAYLQVANRTMPEVG